jgi:hypothetical protein
MFMKNRTNLNKDEIRKTLLKQHNISESQLSTNTDEIQERLMKKYNISIDQPSSNPAEILAKIQLNSAKRRSLLSNWNG